LKWYYQVVPGDSWDFDSVQQLMLADITINGRQRKVLMQANKNGFYYVLDRVTGAFISAQPFAQVNWAKGIDPETGRPIVNPEAHYDHNNETISISPGPGGAHNWSPMSYNPATGLVYVPANMTSSFTYTEDPNFVFTPGRQNMGIVFGRGGGRGAGDAAAAPAAPPPPPKAPPMIGPKPAEGQRGVLLAWNPVTQQEVWRANGGGNGGGTLTTAGNLVLHVLPDGRLMAYTADKGEKLLEVQTNLRGGMGPPITYMLDGKQYVSFMGGTGAVGGRGAPPPPPAGAAAPPPDIAGAQANAAPPANAPPPPAAGQRGPAGPPPVAPKLLTFVLDGTAPLPAAAQ
jgi:hypothetical protein